MTKLLFAVLVLGVSAPDAGPDAVPDPPPEVTCAFCDDVSTEWGLHHYFPLFGGEYAVQAGSHGFHSNILHGMCVGADHPTGGCEGGGGGPEPPAIHTMLS
jgi:hypothetical protein